jgi:uncharacterized tellurite resistance protein B-like protein
MLKIVRSLISHPEPILDKSAEENRIVVATCVLLLEMAHSDGEFHDMEGLVVEDLLARKYEMPPEARKELIEYAKEKSDASIDLHQFTRQINENFTEEEKMQVVRTLWRIVYADGVLDRYEDYLMRKLVKLLRLSHRQMIEAKVKVLDEVGRENIQPGG